MHAEKKNLIYGENCVLGNQCINPHVALRYVPERKPLCI